MSLLLAGCASPTIHVSRLTTGSPNPEKRTIPIHKLEERVTRPYQILGIVSATGARPSADSSKARRNMTEQAAAMGADALIGYYYDDNKVAPSGGPDCWSQALAVKFLPDGAALPPPSKGVVAIPHVIIGGDAGSTRKAERAASIARKFARLALAQKGYYALYIDEHLPQDFPKNLQSQDAAPRRMFGSPDADLIIPLGVGRTTGWNALFASGASTALEAAAYSKSANQITWRSTSRGSDANAHIGTGLAEGIAHIFLPSAKTIPAVWNGLEQTFQTLPDLSTATVR